MCGPTVLLFLGSVVLIFQGLQKLLVHASAEAQQAQHSILLTPNPGREAWGSLTGGFSGPPTVGLANTVPDHQLAPLHGWLKHLSRGVQRGGEGRAVTWKLLHLHEQWKQAPSQPPDLPALSSSVCWAPLLPSAFHSLPRRLSSF